MQDTITSIYCLCADFLHAMNYTDDPQTKLSSAEVMTVQLVAACFFGGNINRSRLFLLDHGYITCSVSESRLNRRLQALPISLWRTLFSLLGQVFKQHNPTSEFAVDSLPVPACDNISIKRCRLLRGEEHRGYLASKRRYFFGLKVHLLITGQGEPVEFVLVPGSQADISAFKQFDLDLPAGSVIHADRAYTDYAEEDLLQDAGSITLQPQRKKNSKRALPRWCEFLSKPVRHASKQPLARLLNSFPSTSMP